ncbi:MAG: hypothetical protein H0W73_03470 [Bacteroidetes bacterium]|nr:hypothetical protein [Bacteroidota bacterium]
MKCGSINKNLICLLFILVVCSCTNDEPLSKKEPLSCSDNTKNTGITIENNPRLGFGYTDPSGVQYGYYYFTTTLINDSTAPIQLKIAFGNEYNFMQSRKLLFSEVFLLPRALTPKRQQYDEDMSKELKHFLDTRTGTSDSLNITLDPKEQCVMTFGTLTKLGEKEPFTLELKLLDHEFDHNKHDSLLNAILLKSEGKGIPLALRLATPALIPCGQILFTEKH